MRFCSTALFDVDILAIENHEMMLVPAPASCLMLDVAKSPAELDTVCNRTQ